MKKSKKNSNKTFTVINEQKEIVATINGDCNIEQSVFASKVTVVASTTNYSKYKKQEELYIRRIDSLFK
jgi:hypothetical protein